jgi:transglutaminase-like putative cysteine protease
MMPTTFWSRRLFPVGLLGAALAWPAAGFCQQPATPLPKQAAPTEAESSKSDVDRWYVVEMMGSKAGSMHVKVEEKDGKITTSSRLELAIGRGDAAVKISMGSTFIETIEGKPVLMTSRSKTGQMVTEQRYTFTPTGMEVTSTQAGHTTTQTLPLPTQTWMPPAAAERYALAEYQKGSRSIEVHTMDGLTGPTVVSAKREGFTKETLEIEGKSVEVLKTQTTTSAAPGITSTEYLDADLEMVQTETQMGGISMVMRRTTRQEARAKPKAGASPEIMLSTFVKPSSPIETPRTTTRGEYVLSLPEGAMPDLPTTGTQSVVRESPSTIRLTITRDAASRELPSETAPYLASTLLADAKDEKIVELTKRTLAIEPDASTPRQAELLRRAVHAHINLKNLGVGLGSASEVVRTREGDCSEHGVLLTAMLRAAGIPSRAVTGLIYADSFAGRAEIFGYHMWAQALLPGNDGTLRWVDLDATLPDETPYDATHITLATSDLGDGELGQGLMNVATVIGKLSITVVRVEHATP